MSDEAKDYCSKCSDARWEENESLKKRLEEKELACFGAFEARDKLISLCKPLAEALEGLMEVEPEHCDCGDMNCNDPKIRWDKAKLALEQYRKERGECGT